MDVYSGGAPNIIAYDAKRLLHDSVTRTLDGYQSISEYAFIKGTANILLARIESVVALVFIGLSTIIFIPMLGVTNLFIIPACILNLASRLPFISSFQLIRNFTASSSDFIYRILRVNLIAAPVLFLFSATCIFNTILPGALSSENISFVSIHKLVEGLGNLETFTAVIPEKYYSATGTSTRMTVTVALEEYLRSLSYKNYMERIETNHIYHVTEY